MKCPGSVVLTVGQCFESVEEFQSARERLASGGVTLFCAVDQDLAVLWICEVDPAVVVIDLALTDGSPLAVADFCSYRRPRTPVILKGGGKLLADGSLFGHVGNAAALLSADSPTGDLLAVIEFHARHRGVAA